MLKRYVISAMLLAFVLGWAGICELEAVEFSPTAKQVKEAIELGIKLKDTPEKLFEPYEFGKRGVETNGYVMTKLFQVSQRAASLARKKQPVLPNSFNDILKQDYLLFPLYVLAADRKGLEHVKVILRQGIKSIKPAKLLKDPIKKALCRKGDCLYKRDVYAGFLQKDLDPSRLAVLVISSGGGTLEFPLSLDTYK